MRRVNTADGLYSSGDPLQGVKGTPVTHFFNDVQEEICSVITAAGIALDGAKRDQLLQAIEAISGVSWKGTHIRVVAESGPVLAADRFISIDASDGNVILALPAANSASARRLELHREDATANQISLSVAAGTIGRAGGVIEVLEIQDEIITLLPNAATNNWIRL